MSFALEFHLETALFLELFNCLLHEWKGLAFAREIEFAGALIGLGLAPGAFGDSAK